MKALLDTLRISLAGLAIGTLALGGCSESSHDEHSDHDHGAEMDSQMDTASEAVDEHAGHDHGDDAVESADRTDEYVGILGELTFVPGAEDGKRGLKIHHRHIPNFKRADGTIAESPDGVLGMKSMTMEFPLADGVTAEGFEAGDKVRFSFRVFWGEKFGFEVTGMEKIDPGTEIDFSNAKP